MGGASRHLTSRGPINVMSSCVPRDVADPKTTASGVLLTTCHLQRDGLADLLRLVASVEAASRHGEVDNLRHLILLQGCSRAQRRELAGQLPHWVELLSTQRNLSSPVARNLLIQHLLTDDRFHPGGFVAFPDDDAWYPRGALAYVARIFQGVDDIQVLLCRYGPSPSADCCNQIGKASLQAALTNGACATIFVRGGLLAQLGGFHQLLGLGTELRGGEDTEFVHRAFHLARGRLACTGAVLVGHAIAEPKRKAQYYEGALAALLAHARASPSASVAFLRKVAVGVWLVLTGRMSVNLYLAALRKARINAAALRAGPQSPNAEVQIGFE